MLKIFSKLVVITIICSGSCGYAESSVTENFVIEADKNLPSPCDIDQSSFTPQIPIMESLDVKSMDDLPSLKELPQVTDELKKDVEESIAFDPKFSVKRISIVYNEISKKPIPLDELNHIRVHLKQNENILKGAQNDGVDIEIALDQIEPSLITASGLTHIAEQIVKKFNDQGFLGVRVVLAPGQIDDEGRDLRNNEEIMFEVMTSHVTQINTRSIGQRFDNQEINHPSHIRLANNFPSVNSEASETDGALNVDEINEYLFRINRHPGRMVTTEIVDFAQDGSVELDLLVNEDYTWRMFVNSSNTGTASTGKWIQRFGFVDYQLTNHDDILSVEYDTTFFKHMHSYSTYYEAPIWGCSLVRWRIDAWKSTFTAEALIPMNNNKYQGRQWLIGPSIIANLFQINDLFIDLNAQFNWYHVYSHNGPMDETGREKFVLPTAGILVSRKRSDSNIIFQFSYQKNLPHFANTVKNDMNYLGRPDCNVNFAMFNYSLYASKYFDTNPRYENGCLWLVHELAINIVGQYAFNNRLIPQKEGTLGGLYSVRGYPQGIIAGDNTASFQAEYRWHLPRKNPDKKYYKTYGNRNWDFFCKAFLDGGYTHINQRMMLETNNTIFGTGVGAEFIWGTNLVLRGDYGIALKNVPSQNYQGGNSRAYFSGTWIY